jgi:hypothetical protein
MTARRTAAERALDRAWLMLNIALLALTVTAITVLLL